MARILIVEDYRRAANMIDAVLTVEGHLATVARTGEQAILEVQDRSYDLVLLDIGLPGIDGWSVLRILLHLPGAPPVIVVSGQIDQGDDIKAISLGAQATLLKPFDPEELLATIDRVLQENRK